MRGRDIYIELKSSQYLALVYANVLFDLLHLILIEGFSSIGSVVYDIVEAIAECLQPTVD